MGEEDKESVGIELDAIDGALLSAFAKAHGITVETAAALIIRQQLDGHAKSLLAWPFAPKSPSRGPSGH